MNLLIVHGHKFRKINSKIFSPGGLPDNVLNRYVDLFGNVTVIGRIIDEKEAKDNYCIIENPKIKVVDNTSMESLVKKSDALIIRLPSINGYKAVHLSKKYKKPYLIEVVGCIWDAYWNYGLKGKIVALPAMLIMKYSVKYAPYVVYVSQNFLQRRYPTIGKNVGVSDVSLMKLNESVLSARLAKIEKKMGKLVIGTIASVDVPYKGQEYIIRAIPEMIKCLNREIEYQMVGGGNKEKLLSIAKEYNVDEYVKFLGVISHKKVFEWLDSIDVYIQPSLQEGLCRALVEAMSRGLPCAASRAGGNPEILDNKFIFSINNKRKTQKKIRKVVEYLIEQNIMKDQAKRNFEHALNFFEKSILEVKRNKFYNIFREEVLKCQ